jgi:hypothetical protein
MLRNTQGILKDYLATCSGLLSLCLVSYLRAHHVQNSEWLIRPYVYVGNASSTPRFNAGLTQIHFRS